DRITGPHPSGESHLVTPQVSRTDEAGDALRHEAGGQHAVTETARIARRLGELLVVVDRVEVARRTGVAHEVGAGEVLDHDGWERGARGDAVAPGCPPANACLARSAICSGVGSSLCVAMLQIWPNGSSSLPNRSPQNMSAGGIFGAAPAPTARAKVASTSSADRR